jgi:hypothetical protein
MKLCLLSLSVFAACSVDLSKLGAHADASPDLAVPSGGAGGSSADAQGRLDERGVADLPTIGRQDAQAGEGIDGSSSPGVDDASTDRLASEGSDGGVDGAGGSGGGGAMGGVDGAREASAVDVGLDQTASTDGNSDAVIALDARDAPAASGGETSTDGDKGSTLVKLTGTPFGTGPAWFNGSSTFDKVFDGDITTYDDDSNTSGGDTGIDLGAGVTATVAVIRYSPRPAWNDRLVGGKFQCSTTSQTDGYSDLYTIATEPPLAWTQVTIASTTPCRYLR